MKRVMFVVLFIPILISANLFAERDLNLHLWNGLEPNGNSDLISKGIGNIDYYTTTASGTTTAGFLLFEGVWASQWGEFGADINSVRTLSSGIDGSLYITSGNYYTFNFSNNQDNLNYAILKTSSEPVNITNVTSQNTAGDFVRVNITLSNPKCAEEYVYVRSTESGDFNNDSFTLATGSSTSYIANIPVTSGTGIITFYVLTTTIMYSDGNDLDTDTDYMTLNYNNNNGSNYAFDYNTDLENHTYHPISIDGTNDFDTDHELFSTSTSGYSGYITWDSSNLYCAMQGSDVPWAEGSDEKIIFIYIDTDPPNDLTGNSYSIDWGLEHVLPFKANYAFYFKKQLWSWGLRKSDDWNSDINYNGGNPGRNGEFVEFKIPLSDIGNPTKVKVVMFFQDSDDGSNNWVWASVPSENSGGQGSNTFEHYLGFELTNDIIPNSEGNLDSSLPVTLSSFTATQSKGVVTLNWTTESETNNRGFNVYCSESENGNYSQINSAMIPGAGNSSSANDYSFTHKNVVAGRTYWYKLEDVSKDGKAEMHGPVSVKIDETVVINDGFALANCYPNPFNPVTTIAYSLPEKSNVSIIVYDINGNQIKSLNSAMQNAGNYSVQWDGTDVNNQTVSAGVYFCKMITNTGFTQTTKMILVK